VVDEAAAVADEVGMDRLTLAEVATRLGVRLPSLYKHVDGLDGLRRGVALRGTRELGDAMASAAVGRACDDAVRAIAHAYREYALARPGAYAASLRAAAPEDVEHQAASDAVLRTVAAVLAGYGVTGDAMVDAARTLRSLLHGFVALESAGGFGLPRDVSRSLDWALDAYVHALAG
jgi:AcrR family transcriptional regulator